MHCVNVKNEDARTNEKVKILLIFISDMPLEISCRFWGKDYYQCAHMCAVHTERTK